MILNTHTDRTSWKLVPFSVERP